VRLALKGEAERNKKHQRDGEVSQMMGHSYFPREDRLHKDNPALCEDAIDGEKFRRSLFLVSSFCLFMS
jgi:hypothetical protein